MSDNVGKDDKVREAIGTVETWVLYKEEAEWMVRWKLAFSMIFGVKFKLLLNIPVTNLARVFVHIKDNLHRRVLN